MNQFGRQALHSSLFNRWHLYDNRLGDYWTMVFPFNICILFVYILTISFGFRHQNYSCSSRTPRIDAPTRTAILAKIKPANEHVRDTKYHSKCTKWVSFFDN